MAFIHDDFLLTSRPARRLYHDHAAPRPIFDYHCHLPPADVAANRRFNNLFEIWLEGDHYKWRAMRSNGVDEAYCTGDADPWEKHLAYCKTVPYTLKNPLYHWSHIELKRYFDLDLPVNGDTAKEIWDTANAKLKEDDFSAHGILKQFDVRVIGTTDDPTDSLEHHQAFARADHGLATRMVPTYRPDKGLKVEDPEAFNNWVAGLEKAVGRELPDLEAFLGALEERHAFFHEVGARLSDHGLERAYFCETDEASVAAIFARARRGEPATPDEQEAFGFWVMREVGRWDAARGWTMQLHLGAMRNNNTRRFRELGPDTGFDSMADFPQARKLSRFLDSLDIDERLPKTVLYNHNVNDYYQFATMLGNFQDGKTPGKLQLGSGWWFLDQKDAMEWQMNALGNLGLLARFVGMLTDSRSFLSYPRHEYFRRVLCNLLGRDIENGEIPEDYGLVGRMVEDICYNNAVRYFGIPGVAEA
ncbi:MAG: glucuronate isomerase [Opitutales bacterium]